MDDMSPPTRARWRALTRTGGVLSILAVVEPLVTVALLFSVGFSGMLTSPDSDSGIGGALLFLAIANLVIGPALAILGLVLALVGASIGARGSISTTTRPRSLVWWGIGLAASALLAYAVVGSGLFDAGLISYVFFASVIGGALVIAG